VTLAPSESPIEPAAEPPPAPLPTLDLGQVVDAVIALYRQRPGLLLGLCAVLQVPAAILAGLILLPLPARFAEIFGFDPFDPPATIDPTVFPTPDIDQIISLMVPIWLAVLVTIVASTLTTIAVAEAVMRLRLGQTSTIAGALGAVLRRLVPILGALIVYSVALIGLVILAFVGFAIPLSLAPGALGGGPLAFAGLLVLAALIVLIVFVSIRWTFWPQAVILDRTGPVASLGRSWRLIAGSTWRVVGYALLFGLAAGILQSVLAQIGLIVLGGFAAVLAEPVRLILGFVINTLTGLLLAPVVPVAMTLLYVDLRVRRGERLS
jgi:hypothetical protein